MKNDIKETFKTPLIFHWSVLILLFLFIMNTGIIGVPLFILLMVSLLFHEYAHVYQAVRENVHAVRVMIYGLGAAAMLDPYALIGQHKMEFRIAAAGPIFSLLLGVIALPVYWLFPNYYTGFFVAINVALALFNLLPMYPTDGGRILNSLLSLKFGSIKGIKISVTVSFILCGIGFLFALYFKSIWFVIMFPLIVILAHIQKKQILRGLNML